MSTQTDSLNALNIPPLDAAVLAHIKQAGPLCRSAISAATGVKEGTLCGAIDRLMKRGEIRESACTVLWVPTNRKVKAYEVNA